MTESLNPPPSPPPARHPPRRAGSGRARRARCLRQRQQVVGGRRHDHGRRRHHRRPRPRRRHHDRAPTTASTEKVTLRLGYFPNITHATALVGVDKGIFQDSWGRTSRSRPRPSTPARGHRGAVRRRHRRHLHRPEPGHQRLRRSRTARPSGSSPAPRRAARSWSSSPTSTAPADLKGKTVATPQLGNTQDVALRAWLKEQGPDDRHRRRR